MSLKEEAKKLSYEYLQRDGFIEKYNPCANYLLEYANRCARKIIRNPRKIIKSKEFKMPTDSTLSAGVRYLFNKVQYGEPVRKSL